MIWRNLLAAVFVAWALCSGPSAAQNVTCATRPSGDNSNACASTAFVQGAVSTPLLTQGYIFVGNASNVAAPVNGTNSLVAGGIGGLTTFSNIITGQNYGAAMTNTGEAYGYSFRNSTTTGNTIYSAIYPGVSNQDGIQSVINIPATATLGSHGSAISAYFDSNVAASGGGNNAVGLFSTGRCIATDSACFGLNTLLMDASTRTAGSGTGRYLIGAEYDFNVMNTGTQVIGVSVGGNSLSQPVAANAFIANTLGTGIKWQTSFYSQDGVADQAFVAGASATSGTSVASQPIWLQYFNSSGTKKKMVLLANNNSLGLSSDDVGVNFTVGTSGINSGTISIAGGVSGAVTFQPQAAAGTYNFNLPITAGSSGDLLTSGGGGVTAMTWTTPGALTKTDDTNVTLTLGGTPTTALLHAASLTLGWTGQLSVARGGTGLGSGTSGGILCYTGSTTIASSSALTTNAVLKGGGAGVCPTASGVTIDSSDNTYFPSLIVVAAPNSSGVGLKYQGRSSDDLADIMFTNNAGTAAYGYIRSTSAGSGTITILAAGGGGTPVLTANQGAQIGSPTGGDKGAGTLNVATNYYINGTVGLSATKTVRDSAGTGTCTITFTSGLATASTC